MITNISHDLRTPLTVVLGLIETLQSNPSMNAGHKEQLLAKIEQRTQEIIHTINRFFELVKLESNDVEIKLTPLNITHLCKQNILYFYHQIEADGLSLEHQLEDRPIMALANLEAFDRIMQNLLSNAIKYGREGKVIGLSLREDSHSVYVEVWDRGRGMDKSIQDFVFDRLDAPDVFRRGYGEGSGLGLAITKQLVEKMQGTISLSSEAYEKTSITFKINRVHM